MIGGLERVATAAARNRVRIVDGEASPHQAIDVVDLGNLLTQGGRELDVRLKPFCKPLIAQSNQGWITVEQHDAIARAPTQTVTA